MNILNLAYYIIYNVENVSPLKLQKLLYYVKVWSLVGKQPVIIEPFEKWSYGPVNPAIYHQFKHFGNSAVPKHGIPEVVPSYDEKKIVDFILECYAPIDAITLSALTHQDDPWKNTPQNQTIPESEIIKYYSSLLFAKNFPLSDDKPFYPVETDFHYAYIFDMDEQSIHSLMYPSFKSYKSILQQSKKLFEEKIFESGTLS